MITHYIRKFRSEHPFCMIVSSEGVVHYFNRRSISNVCYANQIPSQNLGDETWEIIHPKSVSVVIWGGNPFTQRTWEGGFYWLAEKAPLLTMESFEAFIRTLFSTIAEGWDRARMYEHELGFPATREEIRKIEAHKEIKKFESELAHLDTPEKIAEISAARERIAQEKIAYERMLREKLERSPFREFIDLEKL